eukprot:1466274-Ditylum_brightwellii.AAC.1
MTNRIYDHLIQHNIPPVEQKGNKMNHCGCKDHLVLGKIILEQTKNHRCNLSIIWIDYQKNLHDFIVKLIPSWRRRLYLHHANDTVSTKELFIKSGIFQGDLLSPLIYWIALFPLSRKLHQAKTDFSLGKIKVLHLLFINNLKLYVRVRKKLFAVN